MALTTHRTQGQAAGPHTERRHVWHAVPVGAPSRQACRRAWDLLPGRAGTVAFPTCVLPCACRKKPIRMRRGAQEIGRPTANAKSSPKPIKTNSWLYLCNRMGKLTNSKWLKNRKCFKCLEHFSNPKELVAYLHQTHGCFCLHKKEHCFEDGIELMMSDLKRSPKNQILIEYNYIHNQEIQYGVYIDNGHLEWWTYSTDDKDTVRTRRDILEICKSVKYEKDMVYVMPTGESKSGWFEYIHEPVITQRLAEDNERKGRIEEQDAWFARFENIDGRSKFRLEQDMIHYVYNIYATLE